MDTIQIIALTMGTAWASGINLYAAIFMLGLMGTTGNVVLPEEMQVVMDPLVMSVAGLMYCIEFFADKTPGVDTAWDTLHTFIRIPAGSILAMGAVGDTSAAMELTAFLVGGSIAAGTHATKAGARVMINTSPEPFTNWTASISEDILVIGGIWTAINHPIVFLVGLLIFFCVMLWLLPKLWRGIRQLINSVRNLFNPNSANNEAQLIEPPETQPDG
ncbi:MAG: DUF4126 domain-containing protein [Gammaproteobacteria bacterium]|jgi:hypothetical protein|nr:DUF4126 domain-containing protein [Gammaproteobacteria bacterium]